jgi:RIO kinase 1
MPVSGSRRRRFDDADWQPEPTSHPVLRSEPRPDEAVPDEPDHPKWSTYSAATRGPQPVPAWVVTDPRALDADLGVVKTGKEAEVSLVRRAVPDEHRDPDGSVRTCLLACKRYRPAEHRLFHRDAAYLEGRRVRKSREMRAMHNRTTFGRDLIAQRWALAEFDVLGELWSVGAAVPYPVQVLGTELMMEFVGTIDGVAAPRLAELRPTGAEIADIYAQLVSALTAVAQAGYAHGDLSAYNVLVHAGRVVLIDLPQVVDVAGNPQGFEFLRRDCVNICTWFRSRGFDTADADDLYAWLARQIG